MSRAYTAIGSTVHRKTNYPKALRRLRAIGDVLAISSVYETTWGPDPHVESAYTGVALLETKLDAHELLRALRIIEVQLGQERVANSTEPRTIDLKLVLFNHAIINEGDAPVPDPQILQRSFLALALAEVSPQYVHPTEGRTLAEIASDFGKFPVGVRRVPTATARARQMLNQFNHGNFVRA